MIRFISAVSKVVGAGYLRLLVVPGVLAGLLFTGCDLGNSSAAEPGTLTVQVTNVAGLDPTGQLTVGVYEPVSPGPPDTTGALGVGVLNFDTSESVELQVQGFDGVGPTGEPWVGDPGWFNYDLYVVVEPTAGNQLFDASGEYANDHPGPVVINGDTVITFRYPDDFQTF